MGTSNWQHISYCCELLYALAPSSILDIGMGFGRWGMLAREICDVWRKRVFPDEWQVEIVGVEAFEKLIQDYHSSFYNRIIVGDALEALRGMQQHFDLIILGDVLEHFPRQQGEELLDLAGKRAYYTMLNVPLGANWQQDEMYGNPYERHLSQWAHGDFVRLKPVCHRLFNDFRGRTHGVYIFPSTQLDCERYWEGRRWDLLVPSFPELRNIHPKWRSKGKEAALRRYFEAHPRQKALVRPLYHALQKAKGLLRAKRKTARPPLKGQALALPKGAASPQHRKPAPIWKVSDDSVPVLAVVPADWFGVTTSALNNFPNVLLWQDSNPGQTATEILSRGFSTVVFSGMAEPLESTARTIKRSSPSTRLLMHYHGSFAQNAQPEIREGFRRMLALATEGVIDRIGFAKDGMAPVVQMVGIDACYVPNRAMEPSVVEHHPARSPRRVGVFVRDILRKNAHTQFVAASLLEDVEIHTHEVPELFYLPRKPSIVMHGNLPHEEFLELVGRMDICFYVSLSECYPMVVVESLIRGVPCLTSHSHEIFQHDSELADKLIVDAPDNPLAIAKKAEEVLADREAIGRRCAVYAFELNRRAEEAINNFLGFRIYGRT